MLPFLAGVLCSVIIWWLVKIVLVRSDGRMIREDRQRLEQERRVVLDFMHNMVEIIGEGNDKSDLYQQAVHGAILSTEALSASIYECQEDGHLRVVASEGLFPPLRALPKAKNVKLSTRVKFLEGILETEVFALGEGLVGSVAKEGKPLLIRNTEGDPRVVKHEDPSLLIRSLIVVPMAFREELLGVLVVVNPADGSEFTNIEFSVIQSLAEQAALALRNSNLLQLQIEKSKMDMDLSLASNIQGLLLPVNDPQVPGLDLHALYTPAQKVGGDLYNYFRLSDHEVGVAIADVSGKGIPASLMMTICQTSLRHHVQEGRSPKEVLQGINHDLRNYTQENMFVTMVYAVIDLQLGEVTLARAGHELPLLFTRDGAGKPVCQRLQSEGMALGMVPGVVFDRVIEEASFPIVAGDIFLLFTDGVTEAVNFEEHEFTEERLIDTVEGLMDSSVSEINEGVWGRIDLYAGEAGRHDDFTLLTVKLDS